MSEQGKFPTVEQALGFLEGYILANAMIGGFSDEKFGEALESVPGNLNLEYTVELEIEASSNSSLPEESLVHFFEGQMDQRHIARLINSARHLLLRYQSVSGEEARAEFRHRDQFEGEVLLIAEHLFRSVQAYRTILKKRYSF